MTVRAGDDVILKDTVTQSLTYYHKKGIPKQIGGFRARVLAVVNDGKDMRIQLYWKNEIIDTDGKWIRRNINHSVERKV